MGATHHAEINVTGTTTVGGKFVMPSAANANSGIKTIAGGSSGAGVVATTKVLGSSRIFLTPMGQNATGRKGINAWVSTIASGSAFTINLDRVMTAGTIATASGRVGWFIINK
jgi:hypothetical protein